MHRRCHLRVSLGILLFPAQAAYAFASKPATPRRFVVDPMRLVSQSGPEKPRLTEPLLRLLRRRGYKAALSGSAANGDASASGDAGSYRLSKLVLLQSTLTPPGLGSRASAEMTVEGALITPAGEEHALGPFSARVMFEASEFINNDVTLRGMDRALTELFILLANAISSKLPR